MATRSIVTSQPDVECDVCERRLLRGEQPEVFLAAGQPRTVCELCAPRAAHQGWKRGSAEHLTSASPLRSRRGRGLLERLRQSRRGESEPGRAGALQGGYLDDGATPAAASGAYDFLDGGDRATATFSEDALAPAGDARIVPAEQRDAPSPAGPLQQAVAVFNAGEYPRRVASLTRSLGAPEVSVREGEAVASSIVIVIAWELCWYTYEVDLDDMQGAQARAIAQGTELSELGEQDRLANALADERGSLALV